MINWSGPKTVKNRKKKMISFSCCGVTENRPKSRWSRCWDTLPYSCTRINPVCLKPKAGLIFAASISITGKPVELPPTPIATAPRFYSTDYIGLINH